MQKNELLRMVMIETAKELYKKTGRRFIPVAGSNRHIHLSAEDIDALFGVGYKLKGMKALSQPGQFAAEEKVDIIGPKGTIKGVRVLGPARKETQVEIIYADSYKLGIEPVIRMSGDLDGSPAVKLVGEKGLVELDEGVIIAARHIHISIDEAKALDFKNGDIVSLKKDGRREVIFKNILIRCGEGHSLELHLDIEEANAGLIKNGDMLEVVEIDAC